MEPVTNNSLILSDGCQIVSDRDGEHSTGKCRYEIE